MGEGKQEPFHVTSRSLNYTESHIISKHYLTTRISLKSLWYRKQLLQNSDMDNLKSALTIDAITVLQKEVAVQTGIKMERIAKQVLFVLPAKLFGV